MSNVKVRINGRGNAWPVILGQGHSFYDRTNYQDLANASCSIIKSAVKQPKEKDIEWDLMIDAGHGAVQYLLKNCNRIPEALFITHPHIDHTLGLDWIVQSHYKVHKRAYPVYSTILCWKKVMDLFPHLENMVEFNELVPYHKISVNEVSCVDVIPYPVYHGESALGACMLFFSITDNNHFEKILFTGDILCPLLREEDYQIISNADLLVADANNRFPYPKSNHWSILNGVNKETSQILKKFITENTIGLLLNPHLNNKISDNYCRCFDYFLNREIQITDFAYTISSFIKLIEPKRLALIHYSGGEDEKYYSKKVLSDSELKIWIENEFSDLNIETEIIVPYVSQHIDFL